MSVTPLRLVVLALGIVAFLLTVARLAALVPALLAPLALIGVLIGALVALALLVTLPAVERVERLWKWLDFRRGRYHASLDRARRLGARTRGQLSQADTELRLAARVLDERERTIAEQADQLTTAYKRLRREQARRLRRKDKASSSTP